MNAQEYDALEAVNWSTLKWMRMSPRAYKAALAARREDTDPMRLGRMAHAAVYDPPALSKVVAMPRFHGGMKDETAIAKGYEGGKGMKAEWEAAHAGLDFEVVSQEVRDASLAICNSIWRDGIAGPLVAGGRSEMACTWEDSVTGIKCKGRCDGVKLGESTTLVELKTSRIIEPGRFCREAIRMGYLSQVAFYVDGLAQNGVFVDEAVFVVVQNESPWDVVVYEPLSEEALEYGRGVYRDCLSTLKECLATNEWPGLGGGGSVPFELPSYLTDKPLTLGGIPLEV